MLIDLSMIESEKTKILDAFLKAVPFDGWNENTLINTAKKLEFKDGYYLLLFPKGISSLTQYFYKKMDESLANSFKCYTNTKVSDKIYHLIELKLQLYSKQKEAIRKLLQYNLLPQNILSAKKQLWNNCDKIWQLAGDTSTDYNYFTKRIILEGIYSSTLLYWLADDSPNFEDTKAFLNKKLLSVGKVGKIKKIANNFFTKLFSD